jgi:hypothetical protein
LYQAWALGVIFQCLTELPDRASNAVVGVEENIFAPNPRDDFIPGDNLAPVLNEQDKYLQGNALQLYDAGAATQFPEMKVKLITFAEPDRFLHKCWVGSHRAPPMEV